MKCHFSEGWNPVFKNVELIYLSLLKPLSLIIVFIGISSLTFLPIAAYSQDNQPGARYTEAEVYYNNGLNSLKSAKALIDTIKPPLFTLINDDPQKWPESFNIVSVEQTRDRISKIMPDLNKAIEGFSKAIQLRQDYSEAYIRLAETYLAIGDKSGAINAYESGLQKGFNTLNIPFSELKPIFHEIAVAYITDREYSEGSDPGKVVIEKLISLENSRLESEYKQLNSKYDIARRENAKTVVEETHAEMVKNEIERMINEIELVRYYIDTGRREEAEKEYEINNQEYIKKSGFYNDEDKQRLRNLHAKLLEEIEAMGSLFNITVDKKILDAGKKASVNIIPQGNYADKLKFFRLMLMKDKMSLNLLTHITVDETANHKAQIIPGDTQQKRKYIVRIKIPELMIKEDNILPFKAILKRGIYEQDPMTTSSLKNETRLSLKGSAGPEIKLNFGEDVFANATRMEIKKQKEIKKGLYEANIEIAFDVIKSQEISISLAVEDQSQPPPQQQANLPSEDFRNYSFALLAMLILSIVIH